MRTLNVLLLFPVFFLGFGLGALQSLRGRSVTAPQGARSLAEPHTLSTNDQKEPIGAVPLAVIEPRLKELRQISRRFRDSLQFSRDSNGEKIERLRLMTLDLIAESLDESLWQLESLAFPKAN